jgi:hypothetical protein
VDKVDVVDEVDEGAVDEGAGDGAVGGGGGVVGVVGAVGLGMRVPLYSRMRSPAEIGRVAKSPWPWMGEMRTSHATAGVAAAPAAVVAAGGFIFLGFR